MATYLQGVTDYIPEFQPFQPDLGFYANVLQAKQTQYDNNWKAINKIYGQYFYSELSRQDNLEIKDQLMKNIDFNLKRISGLDLSLDQNVQQAVQVFKPFYEDQYLMKDMAWTKNYQNQRGRAEALKNAKDVKERDMYWLPGVKALDYRREEFKNIAREETLGFDNVNYTPNVKVMDVFKKAADEWGISYDQTAPDPSGMYMIRQKNGDPIIAPLQTLFQSYAANDAQLQDYYSTQSYVNRKDSMYQNAGRFNGDLNAAERDYLNTTAATISNYVAQKNGDYQQQVQALKQEKNNVEQSIEKDDDDMFTLNYLKRLDEAAGYTEQAAQKTEELNKIVNESAADATPEEQEDIENLRRRVDAGVASILLDGDISRAAYLGSRRGMVYEMKESQRGLEALRQQNRLAAIAAKQQADEWNVKLKYNLDNGIWGLDENNRPYRRSFDYFNSTPSNAVDPNDPTSQDKSVDVNALNQQEQDRMAAEYAEDWIDNAVNMINGLRGAGLISKEEYENVFSEETPKEYQKYKNAEMAGKGISKEQMKGVEGIYKKLGLTATMEKLYTKAYEKQYYRKPEQFRNEFKTKKSDFLLSQAEGLPIVKAKVDALASKFRKNGYAENYINNVYVSSDAGLKMEEFIISSKAQRDIRDYNTEVIQNDLMSDPSLAGLARGNKKVIKDLAEVFYDGETLIDKDDFVKIARGKLKVEDKDYYIRGKIAGDKEFIDNKLTREILTDRISKLESTLTKEQKNDFINKVLYEQKKYAASKKEKKGRGFGAEPLQPFGDIQRDFMASLNDADKYAERVYNVLKQQYNRTVLDPLKLKSVVPVFSEISKSGGRIATYGRGESGVEVRYAAPETFKPFDEFIKYDLSNLNLNDQKVAISINGTSKSAFDQAKEQDKEDGGLKRDMLYRLVLDMHSNIYDKTKVSPFKFAQQRNVAEDMGKGAMIIYPSRADLEKYKAKKGETGGFTADEIDMMVTKGISVIAPKEKFNNSLFKMNEWTPMQTAVKASPNKPVVLSDPMGSGQIKVSQVKFGPGDYNIEQVMYEIKPNGTITKIAQPFPNMKYGNNLDQQVYLAMNDLKILSASNLRVYRSLSPELKRKVSESPLFKNVPVSIFQNQ